MKEAEELRSEARRFIEGSERELTELPDNLDATDVMGVMTARGPLVKRCKVSYLINELRDRGTDVPELERRYEKLNEEIAAIVGEAYLERLLEELQHLVDGYSGTVCHFLELDPVEIELANDLDRRDAIEILFLELEEEFDLSEERTRVSALDEVLRCRYEMAIDIVLDHSEVVERTYLPDSFWWRHPSKVADSKERS